jgi:hypothetical protein
MKSQYRKEYRSWSRCRGDNDFVFVHQGPNYFRRIRTFQEARRNLADDLEYRGTNMRGIRPCRRYQFLDPWNDWSVSRNYGKSWKDFTKYPKQWMDDSEPVPSKWD